MLAFFSQLRPCLVAMEACGGAHFWGREIGTLATCPWVWLREDITLVPGRVDAMHHIYSCSRNAALLGQRRAA